MLSNVYLREEKTQIRVLNGLDKPEVPSDLREKWQRLVDQLSTIFSVPASLIMRMTDTDMQVFLSSKNAGNPYPEGAKETLGHGLYCETVIGRNQMLEITDSEQFPDWRNNPDVKLGMISYLGLPIHWPDGSVFGTICSLDSTRREYDSSFKALMDTFREIIELDLKRESEMQGMKEDNTYLDHTLREIHHRIQNHFFLILGYLQMKQIIGVESVEDLINDIENRIHAVSLIHKQIYKASNLIPDVPAYFTELMRLVVSDVADNPVDLRVDVENISLGKRLPNFGTVVVELVTNSMKYGFVDIEEPRISLSLKEQGEVILFRYADNGVGLNHEITEGLGMTMLRNLANSIQGKLEVTGDGGFSAVMKFPSEKS